MLKNEIYSILRDARENHAAGRFNKAESLYQKVLEFEPNDAEVQSKLGAALAAQGKYVQSLSILNRAIENAPNLVEAHINLGAISLIQGNLEAAISSFELAIELDPNQTAAHINLGNILLKQGNLNDAANSFNTALNVEPYSAQALNGLATTRMKKNELNEASKLFSRALKASPDQPEILCNMGILLRNQGKYVESEKTLRKAIAIQPKLSEFHINLGNTLKSQRDLDGALECYHHSLSLDPKNADAHWNKAQVLLLLGHLEEGFLEYEWRTKCFDSQLLVGRPNGPRWDGSNLNGKKILVYCEQGFGDSIQFVRYAKILAELGAQVIVKCQLKLQKIFETIPEISRVITSLDKSTTYHFQASVLSLPYLLETNLETIPAQVPYLFLPKPRSKDLISNGNKNIGIVWAGSSSHQNDQNRSTTLENFIPLLNTEGFNFYNLQFGERGKDIISFGLENTIINLEKELDGFMATASFIEKLDLIISIDTSMVHLAGALGKPVWTLLSFVPDWRWMLGREDSPWYPSMRLFRQSEPGNWKGVIEDVQKALHQSLLN
jgi:tetratricopeptide (TPR) repeat protein